MWGESPESLDKEMAPQEKHSVWTWVQTSSIHIKAGYIYARTYNVCAGQRQETLGLAGNQGQLGLHETLSQKQEQQNQWMIWSISHTCAFAKQASLPNMLLPMWELVLKSLFCSAKTLNTICFLIKGFILSLGWLFVLVLLLWLSVIKWKEERRKGRREGRKEEKKEGGREEGRGRACCSSLTMRRIMKWFWDFQTPQLSHLVPSIHTSNFYCI